ncbi:MAG: transcriptional regulator [Candidatus Thorarchaeota archaeon]
MSEAQPRFYQNVVQIFEQLHFDLSTPLLGCGGCFDLVAKKNALLLLVKILENIDSLREEQAFELRKLSQMLIGMPLIVGQKIRNDVDIEDGVVYSRYEIPAISYETLKNLLLKNLPPLIYAHRGGFKVKFDGALLKEKRLEKNFSLGDLASEIGISKRAIYEYERGAVDVSLETALLIEELLDEPLTIAISLFEEMKKIGSISIPESNSNIPKTEIEKDVKAHFDNLGLKDQLWTKKIPFRVLAKPLISNEEIQNSIATITGITKKSAGEDFVKKIQVTYSISKIADANPLVVVGSGVKQTEISGVPVLSIEDLIKKKKNEKKEE